MELTMPWWQLLLTAIGTLGGFEFVKWIFNRKRVARSDEFKLLQEVNIFLQQQLKDKEERFEDQTTLLRKVQRELLESAKEIAEKEIKHAKEKATLEIELAVVRCNDEDCPFRLPPNGKTKPLPGLTKEQYHAQKQIKA